MAYYLVSKRGNPVSENDIEKVLKEHTEEPPKAHQTETKGLFAMELGNELAKKLIQAGFSVSLFANASAQ